MQYYQVTEKSARDIANCFSNPEEVDSFFNILTEFSLSYLDSIKQNKDKTDDDVIKIMIGHAIVFAIMCRNHYELIQEMVHKLEFQEIDPDDLLSLS